MKPVSDLDALLGSLDPKLSEHEYVVVSIPGAAYGDLAGLKPRACFAEAEGLTLLLEAETANRAGFGDEARFRMISLSVHSSLLAAGLTAAVSSRLAAHGIPANLWAAHFHDHVLVPSGQADEAIRLLRDPWT